MSLISHYKVLEKIGEGGMGKVYRVEDINLSREVAIKVLPEKFTQEPQRLARFDEAIRAIAFDFSTVYYAIKFR